MKEITVPAVAVFDVYDTLVHWRHTVEEMALEIGRTAREIFANSVELVAATDLGHISYEEYGARMAEQFGLPGYAERVIDGLTPIQEVHELAHDFHEAGSRLILASNVGKGALRSSFENGVLPPLERFHGIVQSCSLGIAKPHTSFFQHILERTGAAPGEHLFLDDNPANLVGAASVGMEVAHINPEAVSSSVKAIRERYLPETLAA